MTKQIKLINFLLGFLIALAILPLTLMNSIQAVTFDENFFIKEYTELDTASTIGISDDELLRVTRELLDYIKGDIPSLDGIKAEIKGEVRPVFNDREKAHMVDVKALFDFGFSVRNISLLLIIVILIILFFTSDKKPYRFFSISYLITIATAIVLVGVLIISIQSNFTYFWGRLHYLFFDNDLWLLDPNTDIMIQMVPENFFYSAVKNVIIIFLLQNMLLVVASFLMIKYARSLYQSKAES